MSDSEETVIKKPRLSILRLHHEASVKAKTIMGLAIVGTWIPFIPSVIALLLVKPALRETPVNDSTSFLVKWGKRLSWLFVGLNTAGLIALIVIYFTLGSILAEACLLDSESEYCQYFN